jgi:hypothetical protein
MSENIIDLPESDAAPQDAEPATKKQPVPDYRGIPTIVEDEPDPAEQERQEAFDSADDE